MTRGLLVSLFVATLGLVPPAEGAEMVDLTVAVVVIPEGSSAREKKAATMLVEEVERRSGVRWEIRSRWPEGVGPS